MGTLADIEALLDDAKPEWVDRVLVREMVDAEGEPALEVVLVIKDDRLDVVGDGELLATARHQVHLIVEEAGISLWPYTRFRSVSDLAA